MHAKILNAVLGVLFKLYIRLRKENKTTKTIASKYYCIDSFSILFLSSMFPGLSLQWNTFHVIGIRR